MNRMAGAAILLAALGAGCASGIEELESELRQADLDFAAETAARGAAGWAEFFLPDGVMFPTSGKVEGQDAIRARMASALQPGSRLEWEPVTAVAAESGTMGYTIGRWTSLVITAAGTDSVTGRGNYVTIWRRDADGRWRVAADIGNTDGQP